MKKCKTTKLILKDIQRIEYLGKYAAGSDGFIYSINTKSNRTGEPKKLKPILNKAIGLYHVNLYGKKGRSAHKVAYIHRLIAEAFLPKPSPDAIVVHKSSDHSDNRPQNLKWVTSKHETIPSGVVKSARN